MRMGLPPNFDLHFEFAVAGRSSDGENLEALVPTEHLFPQVHRANLFFFWNHIFDYQAKFSDVLRRGIN